MPLIRLKVKKAFVSEELTRLGIEPKDTDYVWTDMAIRSEDIFNICYITEGKTLVTLYPTEDDIKTVLIVKESFDSLFIRLEDVVQSESTEDEV